MDLEQRIVDVQEERGLEIDESFSFDMSGESHTPSSKDVSTEEMIANLPPVDKKAQTMGDIKEPTTTNEAEPVKDEGGRKTSESVEISFEDDNGIPKEEPVVEPTEETFKFDLEAEEAEEVVEEVVEEGAKEGREAELLKRIEELEKGQKNAMTNKDLEDKYSKEVTVMPNISEYDYASMGKEVADNGKLSESTYDSLLEKGYTKDVVDNHIKMTMQQAEASVVAPQEVSQDTIKQNFAKELSMDSNGLDNLIKSVQETLTESQISTFDSMDSKEQIIMLQKFQMQKMQHEQKLQSKKLIKGNSTKVAPKDPNAGLSHDDVSKKFSEAIKDNDGVAINYWGKVLEQKEKAAKKGF